MTEYFWAESADHNTQLQKIMVNRDKKINMEKLLLTISRVGLQK